MKLYLYESKKGTIHRPHNHRRTLCGVKVTTLLGFMEDTYDSRHSEYRDVRPNDVTCSRCRRLA